MQVSTHPFVIGELVCGSLANRTQFLSLLASMPQAPSASHDEVLSFVAARRLLGRGLGWIDMHVLTGT